MEIWRLATCGHGLHRSSYKYTPCSEKPFVLQHMSNTRKPIQMKFITVVACSCRLNVCCMEDS